jgi:hypothetical protein
MAVLGPAVLSSGMKLTECLAMAFPDNNLTKTYLQISLDHPPNSGSCSVGTYDYGVRRGSKPTTFG